MEQEGILYAKITSQRMHGPKGMLDVAGHNARSDVFQKTVYIEKRSMVLQAKGEQN